MQKVMDETDSYSSRPLTDMYLSSMASSRAWTDEVHEEDGGHDQVGPRPQDGRRIMEEDMRAWLGGTMGGTAWDDVTGAALDPEGVRAARREEMALCSRGGGREENRRAMDRCQQGGPR